MQVRFDQAELQALEAVYLASRKPKDLGPLYEALLSACSILLRAYSRKIGLSLPPDRREEVVHDAVTRLIEMYLKHEDQESIPLAARLHFEILYQLHQPKQQRLDKVEELQPDFTVVTKYKEDEKDPKEFLDQLATDPSVDGKRIVIDLYRSKYYRRAVLAIAAYTKKKWIYDHAVELHTIWELTRRKK